MRLDIEFSASEHAETVFLSADGMHVRAGKNAVIPVCYAVFDGREAERIQETYSGFQSDAPDVLLAAVVETYVQPGRGAFHGYVAYCLVIEYNVIRAQPEVYGFVRVRLRCGVKCPGTKYNGK